MSTEKEFNYIVYYGNPSVGEGAYYHVLIGYTRSRVKKFARNLRLRYEIVHIAKIDYSL